MNRYKYLFKNIGLLTISQFGAKFLSFLLVPLYTSVLSTEEYGTYDLYSTTVSLLVPILTLNIMQAVLRYSLEKENNETEVFSIGIQITLKGSLILILITILNNVTGLLPIFKEYYIYFLLLYFLSAMQQLLVFYARGIENVKAVSISGVLTTFVMLVLNIFFLVAIKWGLNGYFLSYIIALFASCIYLFLATNSFTKINLLVNNGELKKSMLEYSIPLVFNSVAWWINNASDRYIVIWICGIAVNGIYSIAYKIPNILNIFQNIFNQAWTLSAVKDYDPNDEHGFFSGLYNRYCCFMTIICSFLIVADRTIAKLMYANDFYAAWKYVPFLLIAIVFGAMSGYVGGIFSAVKDSKMFAKSTVVGAIVNIILNIVLTFFIGALGAAISTAISFYIVWIMRIHHIKRYIKLSLHMVRDHAAFICLTIQSILLIVYEGSNLVLYSLEFFMFFVILFLYADELKEGARKGINVIKNGMNGGDKNE